MNWSAVIFAVSLGGPERIAHRRRAMPSNNARVWFITGASSGFGRAVAAAALATGDNVVAAVRRPELVADLVAAESDRFLPVELEVTDHAMIRSAVADAIAGFGRIDVLVN